MLPPAASSATTAAATAASTSSTAAFAVRSAAAAPAPRGSLHWPRQLAAQQQRSRRRVASGLAAGVSGRTAATALAGLPPRSASFSTSPLSSSLRARKRQQQPSTSTATAASSSSSSSAAGGSPSSSSDPFAEAAKAVEAAVDTAAGAAEAAAASAAASVVAEKPKSKKKWSGLARRVASGVALGAGAAATIAWGGWVLCAVACLVVYQASQEYYGLVTSQGVVGAGMTPPTPLSATVATACCVGIALWTHLSNGKVTAALAVASFIVLSVSLLASNSASSSPSSSPSPSASSPGRPRFAQLTSSVFGLFYCGYLPSFWIKLRLLSAPAAGSALATRWPAAFGGPTAFTVGLAATLLSVVCVIAADTGAYFTGKSLGKTQLTPASPKKTVEGALGGAACAVAAAAAMRCVLGWPAGLPTALSLGVLVFGASLFGDLLESVMKRDAGLKDAGDLIPGHGGLLDRFDSYIFTGAIVFFVLRFVLPMFGV